MSYSLYTYQCSFCKTTATSTTRIVPQLKCVLCFRFMAFKHTSETSAADWETRRHRPPEFRSPHPGPLQPYTKRPCDTCGTHAEPDALIVLSGVGKFCSEDCANVGVAKHEQFMERIQQLYERKPWLRSPQKETTR